MLHYRRIQREDQEITQITCNKCGKVYAKAESHPDFTTIKNTYGYGSTKDGDKYVSHVCEPCMDAFYATFAVPPQVVSMIIWGEEAADPVLFIDENAPPRLDGFPGTSVQAIEGARLEALREHRTPTTPVAPVVGEEHASQEETPQEG